MIKLALALYILFLMAAAGLRAWVQHRSTGDHGFRGLSARSSALEWTAGALVVVSFIALGVAPVTTLIGILDCIALPTWLSGLGAAIAIAGFVLVIAAQLNMGDSWRVGVDPSERTELVTGGLFSVVRNPIFSSLGVFVVGYVLMVPNACSAIAAVLGAIGINLQVRCVEEPFLLQSHGDAYREYARRVGRFLPLVGRLAEKDPPDSG